MRKRIFLSFCELPFCLLGISGVAWPQGIITTFAGKEWVFPYASMPAAAAPLGGPSGVAVDNVGNVFVSDRANHVVVRVSPDGILTVVAGKGRKAFGGDGGLAIDAALDTPRGIALDADGNLYIADYGNVRIRKVNARGIITTVAGSGRAGSTGDGGPAVAAAMSGPSAVAVDAAGGIYIADGLFNYRVRKVTPDGVINTVAGNGGRDYSGDGGPATEASIGDPGGVAVDAAGNLYIAANAFANSRIRKVTPDGMISTIAGGGKEGYKDNIPATEASLSSLTAVALGPAGEIYASDGSRVRKITPAGMIVTVAGSSGGAFRDGGPAINSTLSAEGVTVDSAGNLYIADIGNSRVRKVDQAGMISTFAGCGLRRIPGDGGPPTSASLWQPSGVALDSGGNLYIADTTNNRVRKVTPSGIITTVAGGGAPASGNGDGGPATSASLASPYAVAVDQTGNLYVTERSFIRKVTPAGVITTVAGGANVPPGTGDGGPATKAALQDPRGITVDKAGNLYLADYGAGRIRKVTPAGIISTVAGNGKWSYDGDGGPATSASVGMPDGLALDVAGNLYISDSQNDVIRKVSPAGTISTVAGNGKFLPDQDGVPATSVSLIRPTGITLDGAGNIYVSEQFRYKVRKVGVDGIITTVAGTGFPGFTGDGGPPKAARLDTPLGVAVDDAGNLYIADSQNDRIRVVQFGATGVMPVVTTVMNGAGFQEAIAASTWIGIQGTNLSPVSQGLDEAEILSGKLLVEMAGVRVNVNDKPAYVSYVSPTEVHALVGADEMEGTVPVEVITPQGKSASFPARQRKFSPGLLTYLVGNALYVRARAADGTQLGKPQLGPDVARPARPGEAITLYGTGFGPTDPPVPLEAVVGMPAPAANPVHVLVDAAIATVSRAVMVAPGIYEIGITVPDLADGDHLIIAEVAGYPSQTWALLTVKR